MNKYLITYWYLENETLKQGQQEVWAENETEAISEAQRVNPHNFLACDSGLAAIE